MKREATSMQAIPAFGTHTGGHARHNK